MALVKTSIPVKFAGGLDQKTAEQLVVPGSFLRLDNCVRRKTGRIEKRNGFEDLGNTVSSTDGAAVTTVEVGNRIDTFNDNLLLAGNGTIYSYLSATDQWLDQGDITSVLVDTAPLVRNSFKQAQPDIAHLNGLTVSVYEDSRTANTVRYSVYDDSTGTAVVFDALLASTAERPRVVTVNGNAFMFGWRDTGTSSLMLAKINVNFPTDIETFAAVEVGAFAAGPWDFISDRQFAMAVINTTGSEIRLIPIDTVGDVGNGITLPVPLQVAKDGTLGLALYADQDARMYYIAAADSSGINGIAVPRNLATAYTAANVARTNIRNVTLSQLTTGGPVRIYLEHGAPATVAARKNQQISTVDLTLSGITLTAGALTAFKRSVGLASKAWVQDGSYYVMTAFDSSIQPTYFVLRDDGYIVAKINQGLGGGLTQDSSDALKTGLPSVWVDSDGRYITAGRQRNNLKAAEDGSVVSSSVGIQKIAFTHDSTDFDSDTLGENYHLAGGIVLSYDGVSATELNFHVYPEDVTAVVDTGTGSLPAGTYYYAVTYEWQDARGQIHRSAPSVPIFATTSGADLSVTITVPTLRLTSKTGTRADVKVVLYSGTVGDDVILYRLSETTNSLSADTVTFTDSAPRAATFITGEVLYTTGGVVESVAPPAAKVITAHKNRLFLGGLEDGMTVAYTREHVYSEGACFSDFFTFRVDPRGGSVTALASLDDKLVIFKRDAIFVQVGDGPLDTGQQSDYGQPQLISSDVGCITPKSIVTVPGGVMFKSDKGIYMLDRSLQTLPIGDPVSDHNSETITSAVVMEDQQEVRFTTAAGPCLVYNYEFNQWSTFSNYEAVSACRALDSYVHLKSNGLVRKENSSYNDAGSRYSMSIETSWMSFGDLQGYQRIYYVMGLGDYLSNHHTRVKLAYDFEDGYSETVYFNVDNGLDISYYGDDATYGDSDVYGGSGQSIYQWYLRPRRQKCQSMKLLIEDVDTVSDNGDASFNFVGLTFMAGIKNGGPRLRGGQEIGRS